VKKYDLELAVLVLEMMILLIQVVGLVKDWAPDVLSFLLPFRTSFVLKMFF